MKKLVTGFLALALMVGVGTAFTTSTNASPSKLATHFWYKVDATNTVTAVLGNVDDSTIPCNNASTITCAAGYNSDQGFEVGDPITVTPVVARTRN